MLGTWQHYKLSQHAEHANDLTTPGMAGSAAGNNEQAPANV